MRPPMAARVLGYAGLIPFFCLAATAVAAPDPEMQRIARDGALTYGAAILSFMGGCRWGFAAVGLGAGPTYLGLGLTVLPALLAWAALWAMPWIGAPTAALLLAAGFAALYIDDARTQASGGAPEWWTALRLPLTIGAALSTLAAGLL